MAAQETENVPSPARDLGAGLPIQPVDVGSLLGDDASIGLMELLDSPPDQLLTFLPTLEQMGGSAYDLLNELKRCQTLVQVDYRGYGGTAQSVRPAEATFVGIRSVLHAVMDLAPGAGEAVESARTFTEPILGAPLGLLTGAIGGPATTLLSRPTFVGVEASWTEEFVTWERVDETYYVALPFGLTLVQSGIGRLTLICGEADSVLYAAPPDPSLQYDYWDAGVDHAPEDDWVAHVTSADAWIATDEDLGALAFEADTAYALAPLEVINRVEAIVARLRGILDSGLESANPVLENLVECRLAIQTTLHGYGGTVTDSRDGQLKFLAERTLPFAVHRRVPTYTTTTETVYKSMDSEGNFLQPVLVEAKRHTGYDVQTSLEMLRADLAVGVGWTEEYVAWEGASQDVYLTFGAGLGDLLADNGQIVSVCDPNLPIHDEVPDFDWRAWDRGHSASSGPMPEDGWTQSVTSLWVRFATARDHERLLDEQSSGYPQAPAAVRADVEAAISRLTGTLVIDQEPREERRELAAVNQGEPVTLEPVRPGEAPSPEDARAQTTGATPGANAATMTWLAVVLFVVLVGGSILHGRRMK